MENIKGHYETEAEKILEGILHKANTYNNDRKFSYEYSEIIDKEYDILSIIIKDNNDNIVMKQSVTRRKISSCIPGAKNREFEYHLFYLCLFMLAQQGLDKLSTYFFPPLALRSPG